MKPDQFYIDEVRKNVKDHISTAAAFWDRENITGLDIAPDEHGGAKEFFKKAQIKTLNITDGSDYQFDLCNEFLPSNLYKAFDIVICTEVLEHTDNPFIAARNLVKMARKEIYVTTPFNLRIHNPAPDNFRFTAHGLQCLFKGEHITLLNQINTPDRELMPICYKMIVTL